MLGEFDMEIIYIRFFNKYPVSDINLQPPSYLWSPRKPQYPHCLFTLEFTWTTSLSNWDEGVLFEVLNLLESYIINSFELWYCLGFGRLTVWGLMIEKRCRGKSACVFGEFLEAYVMFWIGWIESEHLAENICKNLFCWKKWSQITLIVPSWWIHVAWLPNQDAYKYPLPRVGTTLLACDRG